MRRLVIVILVCASLGGCAGKGGSPLQDDPGIVIDEDENIVVAPELGAVRGTVRNEQGTPVPAARVQVVGTAMFMQTGAEGRFLFTNVSPPEATLRVEAQGFLVWEAPVPLQAQKVSSVNVTLIADLAIDPNARQHDHDMWRGQSEITIMDGASPLTPFDADEPTTWATATSAFTWANINREGSYDTAILLPDAVPDDDLPDDWPALIYPGTDRIEVTVSWDMEDSNIDAMALRYHNATTTDWQTLALQPSGSTWSIDVAPLETDRGHQLFSMWGFALNAYNDLEKAPGGYRGPSYHLGEVDVQITVFKGEVPLEPAHPDFWGTNTSLLLRDKEAVHAPSISAAETQRDPANPSWHDIDIRNAIVPPGTTRLRLDFSWTYPTGNDPTGDGTVQDPKWVLTWRAANQHPASTPFSAYGRATPVEGSHAEQRLVYEFDVEQNQADAYYQEDSRWGFLISPQGSEDDTFYPQWFRWRGTAPPEFRLEVTAFKEA